MKPQIKHFQKKEIQTHLKHALLEEYIIRWASIMGKASFAGKITNIHFIDGFAGKGTFNDGHYGSPKIAISNLFDLQSSFYETYQSSSMKFIIHTIESYPDFQVELEKLKNSSPFSNQIINYKGKFEEHLPSILTKTTGSPSLYFIDPFGYKGVRMDDIQTILEKPSNEVLINVMSRSLGRNYSIENNQTEICKFFGVEKLPSNISDYLKIATNDDKDLFMNKNQFEKMENDIINFFKSQLYDRFKSKKLYTISKRIYSKINPNQYFHLVFATTKRRGLDAMKQSMVRYEITKMNLEDQYIKSNALSLVLIDDLFSDSNELSSYNYKSFLKEFIDCFNNCETNFAEIVDYFLQTSPLPFRDEENNQKSIYDYFKKMMSFNLGIKTTAKFYSTFKRHHEITVIVNIPTSNIKSILIDPIEAKQLELF